MILPTPKHISQVSQALLALALAVPAAAAQGVASEAAQYHACVQRVNENPNKAFDQALEWRDSGGGAPAIHCSALALVALGKHAEAATRLEALAATPGGAGMAAELLAQAGNAWLLAGYPEQANAALGAALARLPNETGGKASPAPTDIPADILTDILVDRARALAALADWPAAERDLTQALARDPERGDAYVFRASARRHQDKRALALEDLELALALDPTNANALLERGIAHRLDGRIPQARADWLAAISADPDGETGKAAQQNLQLLDVKAE